jgi:hypothetical protein
VHRKDIERALASLIGRKALMTAACEKALVAKSSPLVSNQWRVMTVRLDGKNSE